jgi:hypothetical protein
VLISNFAVTLDTVIKHYEWELDRISFSDEWLAAFEETSIRATLMQIRHSLAVKKWSSIWQYIFSLLGLIIFTTVSVILGYIFFMHY